MFLNTDNLGDDIQSYAAKRFLPRIDAVIDRENMDSFIIKDKENEPISVIMNAWYMHHKFHWPPSGQINPLFVSVHITEKDVLRLGDRFLNGLGGEYLRQFEPIGARDESTLAILEKKQIRAYLSGCLTLTISLPDGGERSNEVILTDVDGATRDILKKQFPNENWQTVTHKRNPKEIAKLTLDERFNEVETLLKRYQRAKCVITTRLHCALPCLAVGTPVLLLYEQHQIDRMGSFLPLLHSMPIKQAADCRNFFNISSPPENSMEYLKYRKALEDRCFTFIQEAEENTSFRVAIPPKDVFVWQIGLLAESAWDKRVQIAKALAGADWLKYEGCPVKTIGLYHWRFRNGGAERVVTQLGSLLAELRDEEGKPKYRVVLISDEAPNEEDYPISPLVMREELPPFQESARENYMPRAEKWKEIIAKHRIDAVFYSQWMEPVLFWDLLSVKRAEGHPAFLIHTHNWCAMLYKKQAAKVKELQKIFQLADGIIALSEADRLYWSRCNPRSVYIPNPCFVKAKECRRSAYGKHILWLARIANQKQPLEIPRIMREVCARDPEIICHVVGAYDPNLEKKLAENIEAEGLTEHVILEGFHADVTPFYEKSALFLMTSRYEGFPLTLFEAAAYGLPTVLYEMPWLAYNDLIDGAIAVPQRDASAAAEAIVRIVNDPEEWQRRSDAIYNSALRFEKTDITAYWTSLIESLEKGTFPDKPRFDRDTEILLDQIDESHDNAVSSLMQQRDRERERAKNLERKLKSRERELESVKGSVSFRLGRALTWGPRKVRGLVRCCREHDAKYTFARILYHLHLGPDNEKRGE